MSLPTHMQSGPRIERASAAYFSAIADELERLDRKLVPPRRARLKLLHSAHVPADESRGVFHYAYAHGGCCALLKAGRGLSRAAFDPASYLLDQARSVAALIRLWLELQVYYHSHLRIEVVRRDERRLCLRHYSLQPTDRPAVAETLILSGLLIARLQRLGCGAIRCEVGTDEHTATVVYDDGRCLEGPLPTAGGSASNLIVLSWDLHAEDTCAGLGRVDSVLRAEAQSDRIICRVVLELSRDLERTWSIAEMARNIGTSSRTLQRTFQRSALSFKCVLTAARLRTACHMLSGTLMPITQIALCCGYTDSAHFSRQFRRAAAMTPSTYRRIGYQCLPGSGGQ